MELVFLVLGSMVLGWLFARLGFRISDEGILVSLIRGYRALWPRDWPIGVQEEDRDRPWGKAAPPTRPVEREQRPMLEQVKPVIRPR